MVRYESSWSIVNLGSNWSAYRAKSGEPDRPSLGEWGGAIVGTGVTYLNEFSAVRGKRESERNTGMVGFRNNFVEHGWSRGDSALTRCPSPLAGLI